MAGKHVEHVDEHEDDVGDENEKENGDERTFMRLEMGMKLGTAHNSYTNGELAQVHMQCMLGTMPCKRLPWHRYPAKAEQA